MEYLQYAIDFVLHIDVHMAELVAQYGMWIYAILFVIIFCETGLVVTPFLPGDSLLFVAGALASLPTNHVNVHLMILMLMAAAILGRRPIIRSDVSSGSVCFATRTPEYSNKATSRKRTIFTRNTAARRSFSPVSSRSCGRLRRSLPEWGI